MMSRNPAFTMMMRFFHADHICRHADACLAVCCQCVLQISSHLQIFLCRRDGFLSEEENVSHNWFYPFVFPFSFGLKGQNRLIFYLNPHIARCASDYGFSAFLLQSFYCSAAERTDPVNLFSGFDGLHHVDEFCRIYIFQLQFCVQSPESTFRNSPFSFRITVSPSSMFQSYSI